VKEIRISLYRLAKNSKVIKALMCAAMNGKKVTAMVELMARFDEASNVSWAKKMKDAGIKVIFGVEGLKVHCKLLHIEARHGNIACIGTGNFHEGTANVYTDFMLMTSHPEIVDEVESVFNFLEQPYHRPSFKHLMVAPMFLRNQLKRLIRTEIENARKGKPAYIYCKVNHIVDEDIIEKLYLASNAGVDVKLLVRGNCSLVTGVKHLSDHIEAYGIIDRYLEHSRILIFANGGEEKYYIGSADWMDRNLNNRVEVYAPVYDVELQQHLKTAVEYGLRDNVKARIVDGTGKNNLREQVDAPFRSQEELYKYYQNV
jgi:polyphosphate kinase